MPFPPKAWSVSSPEDTLRQRPEPCARLPGWRIGPLSGAPVQRFRAARIAPEARVSTVPAWRWRRIVPAPRPALRQSSAATPATLNSSAPGRPVRLPPCGRLPSGASPRPPDRRPAGGRQPGQPSSWPAPPQSDRASHHEGHLTSHGSLAEARAELLQGAATDFLEPLGELAAERRPTARPQATPRSRTVPRSGRRLEDDRRALVGGDARQALPALAALARQEALEGPAWRRDAAATRRRARPRHPGWARPSLRRRRSSEPRGPRQGR